MRPWYNRGARVDAGFFNNDAVIRIGDRINHGGMTIAVGIIEKTRFTADVEHGGKVAIHKGDVVCLIGDSQSALPHEADCSALWLRVTPCTVME